MDPDSNTERAQRAVPDFITGLFDENRALRDLAKNPLVVCADGFQMSVQASSETESDPRADGEPIHHFSTWWDRERKVSGRGLPACCKCRVSTRHWEAHT